MDAMIETLQKLIGPHYIINEGDIVGFALLAIMASIVIIYAISIFFSTDKPRSLPGPVPEKKVEEEAPPKVQELKEEKEKPLIKEGLKEEEAPKEEEPQEEIIQKPIAPVAPWKERLKKGLAKSREQIFAKIESIVSGKKLGEEELEEIEELLYGADLGPKIVGELITELEDTMSSKEISLMELKEFLYQFLYKKLSPIQKTLPQDLFMSQEGEAKEPNCMMIVGINGAGKTTTIGKLATQFAKQGSSVVVGACDTFRAAAVDQLQVWCDRANVPMIRAKEGSDPSGVAYDTLQTSIHQKTNICLLDTAGRLHTKANLMEELKKNKKVLSKLQENAPQHTLLVVDAITGQNALRQAKEFHQTLNLTGIIFTKCDGSSKAGSAVGIVQELKVPIAYIGVGETVEDLRPFNLEEYLQTLLDYKPEITK